jgi:hypothetical protein
MKSLFKGYFFKMSEKESSALLPECRYCLSSENQVDMIHPCACKGSSSYVHERCLVRWLENKGDALVIPLNFNQFTEDKCEVCNTTYDIEYEEVTEYNKFILYFELLKYFFLTTFLLFILYLSFGYIITDSGKGFVRGHSFEVIVLNGFIFIHIVLAIFYLVLFLLILTRRGPGLLDSSCIFCYIAQGADNNGEGLVFLCGLMIILSIVGMVFTIYFDVLKKVIRKHKKNMRKIRTIKEYPLYVLV